MNIVINIHASGIFPHTLIFERPVPMVFHIKLIAFDIAC